MYFINYILAYRSLSNPFKSVITYLNFKINFSLKLINTTSKKTNYLLSIRHLDVSRTRCFQFE